MSFFNQFKNAFNSAYNEEVNAANFQGALVDAVVLSRMITIYYVENAGFPNSLEDTNHSALMSQEAVTVKMRKNGAFHIILTDMFGEDKFIAMQPVVEHNEISRWTCHSNVSAAIMKGSACSPIEK